MGRPKKGESKKEITVRIPIFIADNGDGSVFVNIFKTLKDANRAADVQDQRFDEDVHVLEVTVDEDGNLLDGFEDIDEFLADNGVDEDDEFDSDDDEDFSFDDDDEDIIDED